jgi:phage terminase large subunit-like protein
VPDYSVAQQLALLPPEEQDKALADLDPEKLIYDWGYWGRPSQLLPQADWDLALFLAGRGSGKTRAGTEWVRKKALSMPGSFGLICARTAADARDVLVEGPSGVLAVSPPSEKPLYEPSKRRLTWPNKTVATLFSSEVPDALRGPQGQWALADEIATWDMHPDESGLNAWQNLIIATRLGANPQLVAMTTPKRVPHIRELLARAETDARVLIRRGRTRDNAGNLSRVYLDAIYGLYEGTPLAAQELGGEMLDAVEGALWSEDLIERNRLPALPSGLYRPVSVIAVDPSVAEEPRDECGIVIIVGTTQPNPADRHVYIMADLSDLMPPAVWSERVAKVARAWGAPVVAEWNQGAGLIRTTINGIDPSVRVIPVHSRVGKALRAELPVLATHQGRVHMVGRHPLLEDTLTTWDPEQSKKSPDRLDALVIGCNSFFLTDDSKQLSTGGIIRALPTTARAAIRGRSLATAPDPLSGLPGWQRQAVRSFWGVR